MRFTKAVSASYDCVETMVPRADAHLGSAPLWHGWALREAFLEGVKWSRRKAPKAASVPNANANQSAILLWETGD